MRPLLIYSEPTEMAVNLHGLAKVLETSLDPSQNKQCLLPDPCAQVYDKATNVRKQRSLLFQPRRRSPTSHYRCYRSSLQTPSAVLLDWLVPCTSKIISSESGRWVFQPSSYLESAVRLTGIRTKMETIDSRKMKSSRSSKSSLGSWSLCRQTFSTNLVTQSV